MSFYITLPSNSNMDTHPDNKGGNYVVTLHNSLYLDSSWEAGLAEAIYRRDWPNVRNGENYMVFSCASQSIYDEMRKQTYWKAFEKEIWLNRVINSKMATVWVGEEAHSIPLPPADKPLLFTEYMAFLKTRFEWKISVFELERFNEKGNIQVTVPWGFRPGDGFRHLLNFPDHPNSFEWKLPKLRSWESVIHARRLDVRYANWQSFKEHIFPLLQGKGYEYSWNDQCFMIPYFPDHVSEVDSPEIWLKSVAKQMKERVTSFQDFQFEDGKFKLRLSKGKINLKPDKEIIDYLKIPVIIDNEEEGKELEWEPPLYKTIWPKPFSAPEFEQLNKFKTFKRWWKQNMQGKYLAVTDKGNETVLSKTFGEEPPSIQELFVDIAARITAKFPDLTFKFIRKTNRLKMTIPLTKRPRFSETFKSLGFVPPLYKESYTLAWTASIAIQWPNEKPVMEIPLEVHTLEVTPNHYAEKEDLIKGIAYQLEGLTKKTKVEFKIELVEKNRFVKLTITPSETSSAQYYWKLVMSHALFDQLGFEKSLLNTIQPSHQPLAVTDYSTLKPVSSVFEIKGYRPLDLNRGMDTLWIYSDIIEPQRIGNRQVPLLRIVPTKGDHFGETVVISYEKPHYLGLSKNTISTIATKIYNTYGISTIDFASDVIIKLHFRKKSI